MDEPIEFEEQDNPVPLFTVQGCKSRAWHPHISRERCSRSNGNSGNNSAGNGNGNVSMSSSVSLPYLNTKVRIRTARFDWSFAKVDLSEEGSSVLMLPRRVHSTEGSKGESFSPDLKSHAVIHINVTRGSPAIGNVSL